MAEALRVSLRPARRRPAFRPDQPGAPRDLAGDCREPLRRGCGARSALFLPFANLGLIVVDRSRHLVKQDDGVTYHARTWPCVRARLFVGRHRARLGDAVDGERDNVANGPLRGALHLPDRHGGQLAGRDPAVYLKRSRRIAALAVSAVVDAVAKTLAAGEQPLLFPQSPRLSPITLCRACGHGIEMSACSSWLFEHRFRRTLSCHHCGYTVAAGARLQSSVPRPVRWPAVPGVSACGGGARAVPRGPHRAFPTSDTLMSLDEPPGRSIVMTSNGEIPIS